MHPYTNAYDGRFEQLPRWAGRSGILLLLSPHESKLYLILVARQYRKFINPFYIKELAAELDMSRRIVSEALDKLKKIGLIHFQKEGYKVRVIILDSWPTAKAISPATANSTPKRRSKK